MKRTLKWGLGLWLLIAAVGCRKTEFAAIPDPAYIRVFNCLDKNVSLDNKDAPQPFLAMLIDPVLDQDGAPISAVTVGDFMDTRDLWARPYPDAINSNVYQKEFPGSAKTMAAPVLNGYDLSSWAQVTSGTRRFVFYSRPMNTTPFLSLNKELRMNKVLDTTITLSKGEVYTMNFLEKDFLTHKNMLYVRNENFVKQPFSDSLVYVNFYNLSSEGFLAYAPNNRMSGGRENKLVDTVNVFLTLRSAPATMTTVPRERTVKGYTGVPFGNMIRNLDAKVSKYYSFPLIADTSSNRIYPGLSVQFFEFLKPGYVLDISAPPGNLNPISYYLGLQVGPASGSSGLDQNINITADVRSGLIVTERSGIYNPRYFATVNTVEFINNKIYLTTIQRKFAPPIY